MGQILVYVQISPYGSIEACYMYHIMLHMYFYDFMLGIYESTCVTTNSVQVCLQHWHTSIYRRTHTTISVL